ncbi:hypothetical protein BGW42_000057 [Actinomortierella wolfii]|nr:hypothetical protein BGW42_000057 [Actinomortierella wolfii]
MAPSNKAWIRGRMAGIRKASGIAFSDDIFLSILICLVAKNKHLVMHTHPDLVSDLKTVTEQHCAVVYGLTTATIICHGQQTRQDIIGAITGRHSDIVSHTASSSTAHYQYASTNTVGGSTSGTALGGHGAQGSLGHSQMYHYSNPGDDFIQQRHAMMRYEKSRRSIATTHSEMSEYSLRPSEKYAQSIRTMNGRDQKSYEDMASLHFAHRHSTISASIDPDEQDSMFKRSESRARSIRDKDDVSSSYRQQRPSLAAPLTANTPLQDAYAIESLHSQPSSLSRRHLPFGAGVGGNMSTTGGSTAQVTPMDFTFPKRRHESVSIQGTYNAGNEPSGVTYSGRRLAQAVILDGLENASQEVFAILLEMIVTKEINDRNRYLLPDLIVIAVFHTPTLPKNIPKQLLDHFAINYTYDIPVPIPKVLPPPRKHALFRRTDWDDLAKKMRRVTISNDMMRYIRDVVVGIRTHVEVDGGLTPRASQDLITVVKTLAAIFQTSYVTPDLLIISAEKVISHRLELKADKHTHAHGAHAGGQSSVYTGSGASSSTSLPRSHIRSHSPAHVSTAFSYERTRNATERASRSNKITQSHTSLEADDEDTGEEDDKSFIEKSDDAESLSSFVEKSPNDEELERNEGGRTTRSFQQHHQRLTNREHITPQSRHQVAQHHHQYPPYTSHETHGQHEQYNGSMEYYTVHKSAAEIIREVLNTIHPPI